MAEGLFNFVIAWTLLFAPLLFTDYRRDQFRGSLDVLWGFQMFLTNSTFKILTGSLCIAGLGRIISDFFFLSPSAFLIPYMAIRLNDPEMDPSPPQSSPLGSLMVKNAPAVGAIGGLVCVLSVVWALLGRSDAAFGGIAERLQFLQNYLFTERLAYAFVWDILLYSIFQSWLIGDNIQNVKADATAFVNVVRFVPVVGLVAYLFCLEEQD
jgi:hypothetical protein